MFLKDDGARACVLIRRLDLIKCDLMKEGVERALVNVAAASVNERGRDA